MSKFELVIFDCDGVLVDSELLTNTVLRDMLVELGADLTLEDMFEKFVGHPWGYCLALAEGLLGRAPPEDFATRYRERSVELLREHLQPVPGIQLALSRIHLPMFPRGALPSSRTRLTRGARLVTD